MFQTLGVSEAQEIPFGPDSRFLTGLISGTAREHKNKVFAVTQGGSPGPRGPLKGPRGPFKGPRGPLKGPGVLLKDPGAFLKDPGVL